VTRWWDGDAWTTHTSPITSTLPSKAQWRTSTTAPYRRKLANYCGTCGDRNYRKSLGGTFNDVVLAAITRGFRDLLLSRGESVDRVVRTMVPVSVRPRDASGNIGGDGTYDNKVSSMFAELPVGLTDPKDRLAAISAQMDKAKESNQAVAAEALTSLSGFAPPMLLALGTRLASHAPQRTLNTLTSNVPGPQLPLYAAGKKMISVYPCSIAANGMRIGISIFSYNGQVTFGVAGDYDTAPDLDVLCKGIEQGIEEMVKLSS